MHPSFITTPFQSQEIFVTQIKLIKPDDLITTAPDFC